MEKSSSAAWFESWFDTPYYYALYQSRNEEEAARFIDRLLEVLALPADSYVMDLACGKGRHSRYLAQRGLRVLGVDLSPNAIEQAKVSTSDRLHFQVGDMREPQGNSEFDVVFNLFTSFGYFEKSEDNIQTLKAIRQALKPGGRLLIDFMNAEKARNTLQNEYHLERCGIAFHIHKAIEGNIISKKISFSREGQRHQFEERVQLLTLADFQQYFTQTGFHLDQTFGDYQLNPFDPLQSDRLILLARKI